MFLSAFNSAYEKYGEEKAFKIAWSIVKNKFKQKEGKWIAKSCSVKPYTVTAKSALSESRGHFAEFIFADIHRDLDGDKVPQNSLIEKLDGWEGDIEHTNLYDKEGFDRNPLFKVMNSHYSGDKLLGTVKFNTEHLQFPIVWEHIMKGDFGISMEYTKDWEIVGITGTIKPRNERSKVLNAYTK